MEILKQEPIDLELVADLCAVGIKRKPPTPRDRSKWHVTNLLDAAQLITKGSIRYPDGGEPNGIMSWGRIWESAVDCFLTQYAVNLKGFYAPDVEGNLDGIVASLDGVLWLPDMGWLVCETKLRFSMSDEIPAKHIQQVKAYCHIAGTDLVCYVSGHISSAPPSARAQLRIIRIPKRSIEENWSMTLNTKKYLQEQGCCPAGRDLNGNKASS